MLFFIIFHFLSPLINIFHMSFLYTTPLCSQWERLVQPFHTTTYWLYLNKMEIVISSRSGIRHKCRRSQTVMRSNLYWTIFVLPVTLTFYCSCFWCCRYCHCTAPSCLFQKYMIDCSVITFQKFQKCIFDIISIY